MRLNRSDILRHAAAYPLSEPVDLLKLAFQEALGPGHMIPSPEKAVAFCLTERRSLLGGCTDGILPSPAAVEPLGDEFCRVPLCCVSEARCRRIARLFVASAAEVTDPAGREAREEALEENLSMIRELAEKGTFSFPVGDWDALVSRWKEAGRPPVSHSPAYRTAYRPSYRVVKRSLLGIG